MMDLHAPLFTQAAVLSILPELPAKTLQNWLSRGIIKLEIHNPGREAKRYYTTYGVIVLSLMTEMGSHKVGPSDALDIGFQVANRAADILKLYKWNDDQDGYKSIDYPSCDYKLLKRHVITRGPNRAYISEVGPELDQDNWHRTVYSPIFTVIETDLFVISILNRISQWIADNPGKLNQKRPILREGAK